jgi:hypothetical protein
MNHVTKLKTLSFLAAAVLTASPVFAQSTTRPLYQGFGGDRTPSGDRRQGERVGGGEGGDMGESRFRRGPGRTVTDEQWEDILKFMREVSPSRTAAYDEMTSQSNKDLIKKLVTARYDNLMNVKRDDPVLYDVQIEKTKAEDSIFGILQTARTSNKVVGEEEKKTLREQVAKLVDAGLKERELRIDKAQRMLADAKTRLDDDRKSKDTLVDERLNHYLREGPKPLKMDGRDRPDRSDRSDRKDEDRAKPE